MIEKNVSFFEIVWGATHHTLKSTRNKTRVIAAWNESHWNGGGNIKKMWKTRAANPSPPRVSLAPILSNVSTTHYALPLACRSHFPTTVIQGIRWEPVADESYLLSS